MSVIWIINQYGGIPRVGVYGRHYQLGKRLAEDGHSVFLFSASFHHHINVSMTGPKVGIENVENNFSMVWLKTLPYKSSKSINRILNWFLFAIKLLLFRNKSVKKPDIIYYSSLSLIGTISAEILSRYYSVPYVFEERDIWPLSIKEIKSLSGRNPMVFILQRLQQRAYKKSDLVISPIPGVNLHIEKRNIVNKDFLWLPNGCSSPERKCLTSEQNLLIEEIRNYPFSVGYAGSFGEANRVDVLLKAAFINKSKSKTVFVLIGSGVLLEDYKKFIKEKNIMNIKIINRVDRAFLFELYKVIDVMYLGWGDYSMYEFGVSPNKLSEYMHAGKPILHSYSGRFDFVQESGGGISVPAESAQRVADAILAFEGMGENVLSEMRGRSLDFARSHFDYDKIYIRFKQKMIDRGFLS